MKYFKTIFSVLFLSLSFPLLGCSSQSESSGTRALFETREEAELAAKNFNCTGAHKMGNKWMPCNNHGAHEEGKKHDGHHHH